MTNANTEAVRALRALLAQIDQMLTTADVRVDQVARALPWVSTGYTRAAQGLLRDGYLRALRELRATLLGSVRAQERPTIEADVVACATAYFDERYGTGLGDRLSIEEVRYDADGWHVRGYVASLGAVHCLIDDEVADLLRPADDWTVDAHV